MNRILAEILQGRSPADQKSGWQNLNGTQSQEQPPSSFLGNPIAEIEQGHVVFSAPANNGSEPNVGKRYIKNPQFTNPPMA